MSQFDFAALVAAGHRFVLNGTEWHAHTPEDRHGFGPTMEDALLNVGAQIVFTSEFGRKLIRENGDEIHLDANLAPKADDEPVVFSAPEPEPVAFAPVVVTNTVEPVAAVATPAAKKPKAKKAAKKKVK